MKVRLIPLLACASLAVVAPVLAHHSFSGEYDSTKPITLTGKVTKVEWTNPHARFYIDVKGDDGQTTNWNLELASPNVLKRQGWASNSLKEGDMVTVEGSLARSGAKMANARVVTLADGSRVFARAAADGGA
jgi:uncharacterized protein DUF6152